MPCVLVTPSKHSFMMKKNFLVPATATHIRLSKVDGGSYLTVDYLIHSFGIGFVNGLMHEELYSRYKKYLV